jgi:hypothetical protein
VKTANGRRIRSNLGVLNGRAGESTA